MVIIAACLPWAARGHFVSASVSDVSFAIRVRGKGREGGRRGGALSVVTS